MAKMMQVKALRAFRAPVRGQVRTIEAGVEVEVTEALGRELIGSNKAEAVESAAGAPASRANKAKETSDAGK